MRLPNGYGSVIKLGKRRRRPFAVRITTGWSEERKQKYKYIAYFEKKMDALAFLVEYNQNPQTTMNKKTTLKEVYDQWSERHFPKVSLKSQRTYMYQFKKMEHLNDYPLSELRTLHYQDIIDQMETTSTARTFTNVVKMIYSFALENDIVEKDYSEFIDIPKGKIGREKVPYTIKEINALWKRQGNPTIDVLLILLYTGMRIGELLQMKVSDVNMEERYMIGGFKTEAGRNRTIPIHKCIAPIIKRRLENETYLFETSAGKSLHYATYLVRAHKVFEELEFKHTLHETRHTFISQADRLGINPISLKRIVGHSTKQDITNDTYTHKNIKDLIQAIDLFKY